LTQSSVLLSFATLIRCCFVNLEPPSTAFKCYLPYLLCDTLKDLSADLTMHLLTSRCTCHNINLPVAAAAATTTPHPTADENHLPISCCDVKKTQPSPSVAAPVIVLSLADDLRRAAAVEAPQSTDNGSANPSRIADSSASKSPVAATVVLALHGSPKNLPVPDVSAYRSNASDEDFAVASSDPFSAAAGRRTLRCLSADANAPQPPATTSAVKASSTPFLPRSATPAKAHQDLDTAAHANRSPAGHQPSVADPVPQSPAVSTAGHDPQPAAAAIRYQPVARAPQSPVVIRLNLNDTLSSEAVTSCHHATSSSDLHRPGARVSTAGHESQPAAAVIRFQPVARTPQSPVIRLNLTEALSSEAATSCQHAASLSDLQRPGAARSGSAVPLAEPAPHSHGLSIRAFQPAEGSLSANGRAISHQFTGAVAPAPVLQPSVICLNLANELASTACLVHPAADTAFSPFGPEDQLQGAAVPKAESASAVAHHVASPPLPGVIQLSLAGEMTTSGTHQPLKAPSFSTAQLQAQAAPEPQYATAQSPLEATVAPLAQFAPAVTSQQLAASASQHRVIRLNLVEELALENAKINHTGLTDAVISVPVYFNHGEEMAAVADTPVATQQSQLQNPAALQVQSASTVIPHQLASQAAHLPVILLNLSDELASEDVIPRAAVAPLVLSNAAAIPPLSSSNSTSTAIQPVAAMEDQIRLECGNAQFMQLVAYQCSGSEVKYSFSVE
jgi:hypothetical protein